MRSCHTSCTSAHHRPTCQLPDHSERQGRTRGLQHGKTKSNKSFISFSYFTFFLSSVATCHLPMYATEPTCDTMTGRYLVPPRTEAFLSVSLSPSCKIPTTPKSESFTVLSFSFSVSKIFSSCTKKKLKSGSPPCLNKRGGRGTLMSRWTIPILCRYDTASKICLRTIAIRSSGKPPESISQSKRQPPFALQKRKEKKKKKEMMFQGKKNGET